MLIFLVRHARAGDRDPERWPDDSLRPLTNMGRKIHAQMSRALSRLECVPDCVLTSPWVRALQTAELMVEEMEVKRKPVVCDALIGDVDVAAIARDISTLGPATAVALVGHEPWMSELASQLLGRSASSVAIDFPKSGVIGLDVTELVPGGATLRFFLRPRHIRDLRKKGQ